MNINIPASVTVSGPPLEITLSDTGNAFVSVMLQIDKREPIRYDENFIGSKTIKLTDIAKGDHACILAIFAFRDGALGPTFNSTVTINGTDCGAAKGRIPTGKSFEFGNASFTLTVN